MIYSELFMEIVPMLLVTRKSSIIISAHSKSNFTEIRRDSRKASANSYVEVTPMANGFAESLGRTILGEVGIEILVGWVIKTPAGFAARVDL